VIKKTQPIIRRGKKRAFKHLSAMNLSQADLHVLFVMQLKTRRVHFTGCTTSPHEPWMKQMARELTNYEDGFLNAKR